MDGRTENKVNETIMMICDDIQDQLKRKEVGYQEDLPKMITALAELIRR